MLVKYGNFETEIAKFPGEEVICLTKEAYYELTGEMPGYVRCLDDLIIMDKIVLGCSVHVPDNVDYDDVKQLIKDVPHGYSPETRKIDCDILSQIKVSDAVGSMQRAMQPMTHSLYIPTDRYDLDCVMGYLQHVNTPHGFDHTTGKLLFPPESMGHVADAMSEAYMEEWSEISLDGMNMDCLEPVLQSLNVNYGLIDNHTFEVSTNDENKAIEAMRIVHRKTLGDWLSDLKGVISNHKRMELHEGEWVKAGKLHYLPYNGMFTFLESATGKRRTFAPGDVSYVANNQVVLYA